MSAEKPHSSSNFSQFSAFVIFLTVRLLSVFFVQTSFVPDEYWQSLEIAHKQVFGYGYKTWEWQKEIRSYVYPLIFSTFYKISSAFQLDSYNFLILGPRIIQATITSIADLYFYRWCNKSKWSIFIACIAWFPFYIGSRTLINTFEMNLTSIGLSLYPWYRKNICQNCQECHFLWPVLALCLIRPTAIVLWTPFFVVHLFGLTFDRRRAIFNYIKIGFLLLFMSILIDGFQVTGWNFLKFNILKNIANHYGTHQWHWYLSTGLPSVLGIFLVPFVIATLQICRTPINHPNSLILLSAVIVYVTIFSLIPHKEIRFLSPVLPIFLHIITKYLSEWSRKALKSRVWLVVFVLAVGNAVPAYYTGFVHQRGTLDVMQKLHEIASKTPNSSTNFLFLIPCHSTPLYSHIHVNVTTRFLKCEPNFENNPDYNLDEADLFYENPVDWLRTNFPPNDRNTVLPTHIICFDNLVPRISDILSRYNTTEMFFHTSFPTKRIGRYVVINTKIF